MIIKIILPTMWTKKKKSLDFGLTCAVDDDHQSRTPLGEGMAAEP